MEDNLKLIASIVDWSGSNKLMNKIFYETFGTVLSQKIAELENQKSAIKEFIHENFSERLTRTPTRRNPTTKLIEIFNDMRVFDMELDHGSPIIRTDVARLFGRKEIQHAAPSRHNLSPPAAKVSGSSRNKTPVSNFMPKPILSKGRTNRPQPTSTKTQLKLPKSAEGATSATSAYKIKTKVVTLFETPLNHGLIHPRSKYHLIARSEELIKAEKDSQDRKMRAVTEKRNAYLRERSERVRLENEKCFRRVQENLARITTPVNLLRPVCEAPPVQPIRWDKENSGGEVHNVTVILRKEDSPTMDAGGNNAKQEDVSTVFLSAVEDAESDMNNNTNRQESLGAEYSETGVLDKAILDDTDEGEDENEVEENSMSMSVPDETLPPAMASLPPCYFSNSSSYDLRAHMQYQRDHLCDEQVMHYFGCVDQPTIKDIFVAPAVILSTDDAGDVRPLNSTTDNAVKQTDN